MHLSVSPATPDRAPAESGALRTALTVTLRQGLATLQRLPATAGPTAHRLTQQGQTCLRQIATAAARTLPQLAAWVVQWATTVVRYAAPQTSLDPDLEAQLTELEAALGGSAPQPPNDRLIAVLRTLAGRLAGLDQKVDHLDQKVNHLDQKVDHLDQKVDHLDQKVNHLDQKVDHLDQKVDKGFQAAAADRQRLDGKIDRLEQKVDRGFQAAAADRQRLDGKIDRLEQKVDRGFQRLEGRMDTDFRTLQKSQDRFHQRLEDVAAALDYGAGLEQRARDEVEACVDTLDGELACTLLWHDRWDLRQWSALTQRLGLPADTPAVETCDLLYLVEHEPAQHRVLVVGEVSARLNRTRLQKIVRAREALETTGHLVVATVWGTEKVPPRVVAAAVAAGVLLLQWQHNDRYERVWQSVGAPDLPAALTTALELERLGEA